jgi:phage terminase large subunit
MRSEDALLEELALREKIERERVSPKLEAFRQPMRIKGARGGRGAGAKSWSFASLLVQVANYSRKHIIALREVQLTLEESSWKLMGETIERLKYPGWIVTKEYIDCPRTGSHIIFRGLSDLRADNTQSLEDFDIAWLEEAQKISAYSLDVLFPTIRKPGSEIWFGMNPDLDVDPIIAKTAGRQDMLLVDLEPGAIDNPWWTAELQKEMEADFARDPDLAEHVWNGAPRVQGERAIMSRASIRAAMDRDVIADGVVELGIDVARFGDDRSVIYKRQGFKVVDSKTFQGADTQRVAREAWDMIDRDPTVAIKIDDDGVGGGVTDKLRDLGAKTIPCHNGGKPADDKLYTSSADEQWFTVPIDRAQIPDDLELMAELSARQYRYTPDDRKKIESKADFKKRYGRSPDKADALLLCFYRGASSMADEATGRAMGLRRQAQSAREVW